MSVGTITCLFVFLSVDECVQLTCQVLLRYASLCVCLFACVSLLCVLLFLKSVRTAGVYACVCLIGAYTNSEFDSLWLSEALLLVLLPLGHTDGTQYQHVCTHRTENVFQLSTGAYRTSITA